MLLLEDAAKYYKGYHHQRGAWQWLQKELDEKTLEKFAAKYRDTKTQKNPLNVTWQSQNDNSSQTGYRECFSSSMAMIAMYYGKVKNDDEYNLLRAMYGDTTSAEAQLATLRHLGLFPRFVTDASVEDLKQEIDNNRPVGVGWLHKSHVSNPSGGGHWSVVVGYNSRGVIMSDPNGEADLINGGYTPNKNGDKILYSYKNWEPRWSFPSYTDGWCMIVKPD
tara:strand:- start:826 stop:1488 length:663 start_codon:yes stop_codon:yes gene_type:complete